MDEGAKNGTELTTAVEPDAVIEAEKEVRRYGLTLGGVGVGAVGAWFLQAWIIGFPFVPLGWLGLFLIALVLAFFFPQTRKARLAREVLRHWDEAQVRTILEASGSSTDPRLQTAERMTRRITAHPGADDEVRELATALLSTLREAAHDQRMTEVVLESRDPDADDRGERDTLRDSLDYLEARAGRVLGTLTELHAAVVRRDSAEVAGVLEEAGATLRELRAMNEVDRLLDDGQED